MKILYAMHVNWHWVRQRPHVLADLLATRHELRLLHFAMYRRAHHAAGAGPALPARTLLRLPERVKRWGDGFQRANAALLALQLRREVAAFAPDVIWVTHPDFGPALPSGAATRLVYDCMDDHLAFAAHADASLGAAERSLVQRADLTIFSSRTLADRVARRARVGASLVVNNGVADGLLERAAHAAPRRDAGAAPNPVFGYFGTISHWFDWPLVLRLLEAMPQARLRLAGPVESALPEHPRIEHAGVLPHAALAGFAERCDALLMPFTVTPLIEAVDPVKLYEYIALDRPALAPRYAETERFEPWVRLYRDADEALHMAARIAGRSGEPGDDTARLDFLARNRWTLRLEQIDTALRAIGAARQAAA